MKRICQYDYLIPCEENSSVQFIAPLTSNTMIICMEDKRYIICDITKKVAIKTGRLPIQNFFTKIEVLNPELIYVADDLDKKGYFFDISKDKTVSSFNGPLSPENSYSERESWRCESMLNDEKNKLILYEEANNKYVIRTFEIDNPENSKTREIPTNSKEFFLLSIPNDKLILYPNTCEKGLIEIVIVDLKIESPAKTFNIQTTLTDNPLFVMKATFDQNKVYFWANHNSENSYPSAYVMKLPKGEEDPVFDGERKLNFKLKDGGISPCYNLYDVHFHESLKDLIILEICDHIGIKIVTMNLGDNEKPPVIYNSTLISENDGSKTRACFGEILVQFSNDSGQSEGGIQFKIFKPLNLGISVISILNSIDLLGKFNERTVKGVVEIFKQNFNLHK